MYDVKRLDYYLNGTTFTTKIEDKLLRYFLDVYWTNKKIELLSIEAIIAKLIT